MKKNNIIELKAPESSSKDYLTDFLREKSQELLRVAVEQEVTEFIANLEDNVLADGKQAVVRNGYHPERSIQTGIGELPIQVPKTRDRSGSGINFSSALLPPYLRRSAQMEELIPWLYLKGVSTGEIKSALRSLVGDEAKNLSSSVVSRLKASWDQEYDLWEARDLSKKRYVYIWADGVYFNVRSEDEKQCMLVILGVRDDGVKELVGFTDGFRESEESWKDLLLEIKARGLKAAPKLAIGDGALGFWKALRQVFPSTKHQRCWVHKMRNILDKLPHGLQGKAKSMLQQIWMAETKASAQKAYKVFIKRFDAKYPKATQCLEKDKEQLLAFYDFPAVHWIHIRTTNPIESIFSSVKLRTGKTRGMLSRKTMLSLVFKLIQTAQGKWKKIRGFVRLAEVIKGVKFTDGFAGEEIKSFDDVKNAA
jgi:transposase-like protein